MLPIRGFQVGLMGDSWPKGWLKVGVGLLTTNAGRLVISVSHCSGLGQGREFTSEPAGNLEMKTWDSKVVFMLATAKSKTRG